LRFNQYKQQITPSPHWPVGQVSKRSVASVQ